MAKAWVCANGHEAAGLSDSGCEVCGADMYWRNRPSSSGDPAATDAWGGPDSAWGRIWGGLVLSVVGWCLVVVSLDRDWVVGLLVGGVIGFVGTVVTSIGVIAEGVRLGMDLRDRA